MGFCPVQQNAFFLSHVESFIFGVILEIVKSSSRCTCNLSKVYSSNILNIISYQQPLGQLHE